MKPVRGVITEIGKADAYAKERDKLVGKRIVMKGPHRSREGGRYLSGDALVSSRLDRFFYAVKVKRDKMVKKENKT